MPVSNVAAVAGELKKIEGKEGEVGAKFFFE